jgi:beta-lactamase superfamily II metal-dependent hydrolase
MKFTIHNVGHGQCITLVHDNGNTMMWDCGHSDGYRPSNFLPRLGINSIDYFFVTNYDEDHISDLTNLHSKIGLRSLFRNGSITAPQLRTLKMQTGPISSAMESMLSMITGYTGGPLNPAPEFPGVSFNLYNHSYGTEFNDTNNISLVTILLCNGVKVIIPGDLETDGWISMLRRQDFLNDLSGVNIFIASHHGRENGYTQEIFNVCRPSVVVFSDSDIQYSTQEMSNKYARHAKGVSFKNTTRYVLTTRSDGLLEWNF